MLAYCPYSLGAAPPFLAHCCRRDRLEAMLQRQLALEAPPPTPSQAITAPPEPLPPALAGLEQDITPEVMREAIALESSMLEPSGSMVVAMLSKKLERMAKEAAAVRRRGIAVAGPSGGGEGSTAAAAEGRAPGAPLPAGPWQYEKAAEISCFLVLATLLGFGHGVIGNYLFMYLADVGEGQSMDGRVHMLDCSVGLVCMCWVLTLCCGPAARWE
jgi:hypothetical protein